MSEGDEIAAAVLEEFEKLPAKRKPCVRDNGLHEWVPLSGIVAKGPSWLKCVALATGMKCLPASKLPQANGVAVHDWHAEILALRAFNYFVLQECQRLAAAGDERITSSEFLRRRTSSGVSSPSSSSFWHSQPFTWREDVTLHMYCSEAPCGDASMELIMASQLDASPWTIPSPNPITPPPTLPNPEEASSPASPATATAMATPTPTLPGRGYFSQLGIVRRKPSRGDAPPSLSKSCSDKIAQKQCTSLLCSLASLLVSPHNIYLSSLVLPKDQFFKGACRRCFSADSSSTAGGGDDVDSANGEINAGRMRPLAGRRWGHDYGDENGENMEEEETGRGYGSYAFVPFRVETTTREFGFSKRAVAARTDKTSASNLAVAWSRDGLEEGLVGGMLQGRKQFSPRGASAVSPRGMWKMAREVAALLEDGEGDLLRSALDAKTYDEVKGVELLDSRRAVKTEVRQEALKGWLPNTGDGAFTLQ